METNEKKERYSDAELEEFKALILEKIAKAERDLEIDVMKEITSKKW